MVDIRKEGVYGARREKPFPYGLPVIYKDKAKHNGEIGRYIITNGDVLLPAAEALYIGQAVVVTNTGSATIKALANGATFLGGTIEYSISSHYTYIFTIVAQNTWAVK